MANYKRKYKRHQTNIKRREIIIIIMIIIIGRGGRAEEEDTMMTMTISLEARLLGDLHCN
jgi:hypothetical protein